VLAGEMLHPLNQAEYYAKNYSLMNRWQHVLLPRLLMLCCLVVACED
jgi:hypothetical protein